MIMGLLKPIENGRMYPGWWRWNPIGGCLHGCSYCSIKRMQKRNSKVDMLTPAGIREGYMKDNLGSGRKIFVCSSGDMWGEWVISEDIQRVLAHCRKYADNEYMFLTKNPRRYYPFLKAGGEFPPLSILGSTVESDLQSVVEPCNSFLTPTVGDRGDSMSAIKESYSTMKTMLSVEPVMKFSKDFGKWLQKRKADVIYVGVDSGKNGLPEPSPDELQGLIDDLRTFTDVRLKEGIERLLVADAEVT